METGWKSPRTVEYPEFPIYIEGYESYPAERGTYRGTVLGQSVGLGY